MRTSDRPNGETLPFDGLERRSLMLEHLDFMVRFWQLRARHGAAGQPLSAREQAELLSLLGLFSNDEKLPLPGVVPSVTGIPAQLTGPVGFVAGDLRGISVEGLLVVTSAPLTPGDCTIVRMADAVSGIEFAVPCIVAWAKRGRPSSNGLLVDGIPSCQPFHPTESGMWRAVGWRTRSAGTKSLGRCG
jgi:hypothetical protein